MRVMNKPSSFILFIKGFILSNKWTNEHVIFILTYNLSRKNELNTSCIKKRVETDVHMMRDWILNVILLSLGAGNSNPAVVSFGQV